MKKIILLHSAVAVPVLFLFWLLAYRNTLWWMEGMSFFSTLPDFAVLQARLPSGLLEYVASYLLQFYHSAVAGALLQTLYGWIVMVCADVVVWRVVRRASLSWISFIPVGIFVSLQCRYNDGVGSIVWALAAIAAAIAVVCVIRRPEHYDTGLDRRSLLRMVVVPLVLLAAGGAVSLSILENRVRERLYRVERLAEDKDWNRILEIVSPEVSAEDPVRRRYALLALAENGQLGEKFLRYGVKGSDDFFFAGSADFVGCNFNALLARSLGLDNEVIHQSFQLNSLSPLGYSFRSMRRITDAFLREGNTVLAEKYMRILLHSTCHKSWVESRVPRMISLLESPEQHEEDNILTCATSDEPLLMDMACLWDARPDNRMCADILLCGLLASRQMDKFAMLFSRIYASAYSDSDVLPRYYEEALLVLARQNPDILKRYSFSSFRTEAFDKFAALMDAGRYDDARAAYPDSFWSYLYAAM